LIFHGGGAQIRKKISSTSRIEEKKIEHQHHRKKYRAQKISKLAILYIERKMLQPSYISGSGFWLLLCNIRESTMQSEQYFSRKQRALFVSSENLAWPWPPGSYAPVRIGNTDMIGNRENLYIDAIMQMPILMVELI
jgi:hypothetical protein